MLAGVMYLNGHESAVAACISGQRRSGVGSDEHCFEGAIYR